MLFCCRDVKNLLAVFLASGWTVAVHGGVETEQIGGSPHVMLFVSGFSGAVMCRNLFGTRVSRVDAFSIYRVRVPLYPNRNTKPCQPPEHNYTNSASRLNWGFFLVFGFPFGSILDTQNRSFSSFFFF